MGRMTQLFGYMKATPKELSTGKVNKLMFSHIEITDHLKKVRRRAKMWKDLNLM